MIRLEIATALDPAAAFDVIADTIETCVMAEWMDGVMAIGGCDKNMPGALMALVRMNVPGILGGLMPLIAESGLLLIWII